MDLWAITAYFNPMRFKSRRANYQVFRERLDLPLVAVELAHDFDFDLRDADADVLIRVRAGDVMWQKERLLNIALSGLPADCGRVVWIDCDVVFESGGWAGRLDQLFDRFPLVQAFSVSDPDDDLRLAQGSLDVCEPLQCNPPPARSRLGQSHQPHRISR